MQKYKPYEYTAIDLVYKDKDPVTIAVVPRDTDLSIWLPQHVAQPKTGEHFFVYTYDVCLQ